MNSNRQEGKTFPVGGRSATFTIIICSLLYMINYMDRQVFSVVLEPLKIDLGLSDTEAGIIQSVFLLCIALFSFPAAFLIDRWSRRKAIAIMAIIWSVFTYITGLGKSFWGVLLPRTIVGIGEAGFSAGGTAMISAAYPAASRGKYLGIFNAFIPLGAGLGTILGGYISTNFGGWRTPFFIFAIPGIILGVAAFFLKDYKTVETEDTQAKTGFLASALVLLKIPTLRWLYVGYGLQNITAFSFLVWTPAFLMRSQEIPEDKAGLIVGVISLMAIIGAPLGGFVADFWQKKNTRGRMLTPMIAALFAGLLFAVSVMLEFKGPGFFVGMIFGVVLMMGLPGLSAATQDVVSPNFRGMAWGLCVFGMYVLGGGWAPTLVGGLSDALGGGVGGLKTALIIAAGGGVAASFFFWLSSRTYAEDVAKVENIALEAER